MNKIRRFDQKYLTSNVLHNIFVLMLILFLTPSVRAATGAYFSGESFGMCTVRLIRNKMPLEEIKSRFIIADKMRKAGAKDLLERSGGSFSSGPLSLLIPFSQEDAAEVMAFHFTALLDYEKLNWGTNLTTESDLSRLGQLYRSYHDYPSTDFTAYHGFRDFLNQQIPVKRTKVLSDPSFSPMVKMVIINEAMADGLVEELLKNPNKMSEKHWDLLKKTTEIYGRDPITALAMIGFTFDIERVADGSQTTLEKRNRQLYLGSRMVPIFQDSENPMGDNYHFWLYMNAAIQGKGDSAKIMAGAWQTATLNWIELRADMVGLEAGQYVRDHIFDSDISAITCPLEI